MGTGSPNVTVDLMQGTTVITSRSALVVPTTWTTYEFTLTGSEADQITDYTALDVRVQKDAGSKNAASAGWIELEAPSFASAPDVTGVPSVAAIGDMVTVVGANFTDASSVTFGVTSASFTVVDDETISATVPALTEGLAYTVTVTTPGGSDTSDESVEIAYLSPTDDDTNQTEDLQAWLDAVPDGEYAAFRADTTYTSEGQLALEGRTNLTILGRDATIERTSLIGDVDPTAKIRFLVQLLIIDSDNILVDDLNTVSAGTGVYDPDYEVESAIKVSGSRDVTVQDVDILAPGGDGYTLTWNQAIIGEPGTPNERVHVIGGSVEEAGRQGVAVTSSISDSDVTGVTFVSAGRSIIDLEMAGSSTSLVIDGFTIEGNVALDVGLGFIAGGGAGVHQDVSIIDNMAESLKGKYGDPQPDVDRFNIVYSGNVGTTEWMEPGPLLAFKDVDGLTVTGNSQPGGSVSYVNCSNVLDSGNDWS